MKAGYHSNQVADRLASLSDPVRLRLLRLLESEELSVGEVARVVQMPQSTVSRQLKVLGEAGWVRRRSAGTATLYRMVLDDLPMWDRGLWISVRGGFGDEAELREDLERLRAVLAARTLDSQAFFGRMAGEWDSVRDELFGRAFTANALLGFLPRAWTVADVGCGTGNVAEILSPWVARVIAIDRSEPMLEAARKRLAGAQNVEFAVGEVERLPLRDASVDAATCVLVMHHVPEPGRALAELARVVKPGGAALIVDMAAHGREEYRQLMGHVHLGFERGAFEGAMRGAGFAQVRWTALPGDPEGKGPGLFVAAGARSR